MLLDAFVGLCVSHSIMLSVLLLLVLYLFKGVKGSSDLKDFRTYLNTIIDL